MMGALRSVSSYFSLRHICINVELVGFYEFKDSIPGPVSRFLNGSNIPPTRSRLGLHLRLGFMRPCSVFPPIRHCTTSPNVSSL